MSGGNTVSDTPKFGSKGIESENTADLPYEPKMNDPEPQIGSPSGKNTDTKMNDAGSRRTADYTWKKAP
jgi:hypothetical protein